MNTETDCGETAKKTPDSQSEAPNQTCNDFGKLLWYALSCGNRLWGGHKHSPEKDASRCQVTPLAHSVHPKIIGEEL